MYHARCNSGSKADLRNAARGIRKAAIQGVMDAQYELGEVFRRGLFCDHIYMHLARKYIRRAPVQDHLEAIVRMKELRSCVHALVTRRLSCESSCYPLMHRGVGGHANPVVAASLWLPPYQLLSTTRARASSLLHAIGCGSLHCCCFTVMSADKSVERGCGRSWLGS